MLIVLEEKHKQDLQFLAGQSPQGTVTHTLFMKKFQSDWRICENISRFFKERAKYKTLQ